MCGERVARQQAYGLHRDCGLNRAIFKTVPKEGCGPKIHDSLGHLAPDSSGLECTLRQRARRKVRGHQPKCCLAMDHQLLRVSDDRPGRCAHEDQRIMSHRPALLFVDVTVRDQSIHPAHIGRHKHMCWGAAVRLSQEPFRRVEADAHGLSMRELPVGHDRFQGWLEGAGGK